LKEVVEQYLHTIVDNVQHIPPEMRETAAFIRNEVDKRFPHNGLGMSGGFIFLRFICPSIVTPELFSIKTDADSRRPLILISKVIQNISNDIDVKKEEFMKDLNEFILELREDMHRFNQQISTPPPSFNRNFSLDLFTEEDFQPAIYELHSFITFNSPKLLAQLSVKQDGGELIGLLNNLMPLLGPPAKPTRATIQ